MRQKTKLILVVIISLFLFGVTKNSKAATPTISNISGVISTGQTLTISGLNLADEDKTNWINMFKSGAAYGFEGTSPTQDGFDLGSGGSQLFNPIYDQAVRLSGAKSLHARAFGAWSGPSGPESQIYFQTGFGETGDMWVRFYMRFHLNGGSWPSEYQKIIDTLGANDQLYLGLYGGATALNATWAVNGSNTSHPFSFPGGGSLVDNKWYLVELHWKTSSPRVYTVYVDNQLGVSGTDLGASTLNYLCFPMINWDATNSSFDEDIYMDNLAVSTARIYPTSLVEIGNSSNYDTAAKAYQTPIFLSDSSIQITANLTGLGAGPYYLFVTNNRQEKSAAYTLSGGGSAMAPASPSGLSVR